MGSGILIMVTDEQLRNLVKHTFKDILLKIVLFTSQIWAIKFAEWSNSQNECTTRMGREWSGGRRGWDLRWGGGGGGGGRGGGEWGGFGGGFGEWRGLG